MNGRVYKVSEIVLSLKQYIDSNYAFKRVMVEGEVSGLRLKRGSHCYLTLKDENASIDCIIFASVVNSLKTLPEEGMKVLVSLTPNIYEKAGKLSFQIYSLKPAGSGDLNERFLRLKEEMERLGYFDPEHKKPIPKIPMRIGLVTSREGAALQDVLKVAWDRLPGVRFYLKDALVQGENAPATLIRALQSLDRLGLDLILITRGGGSKEDLFCFHDKELCRAVYEAKTPVVSAVGHEIDVSLVDYVADKAYPTPSAASQGLIPDEEDLLFHLITSIDRGEDLIRTRLTDLNHKVRNQDLVLENLHPRNILKRSLEKLTDQTSRLKSALHYRIGSMEKDIAARGKLLENIHPLKKLTGPFAYIETADGRALQSIHELRAGDSLQIINREGRILTAVKEVLPHDEGVKWNE